jgi:hypothetical protein
MPSILGAYPLGDRATFSLLAPRYCHRPAAALPTATALPLSRYRHRPAAALPTATAPPLPRHCHHPSVVLLLPCCH